jgi:hypothetical protein
MEEYPQITISAGEITAVVYSPNAQRAFYRGTRFDRSGIIGSLRYRGHEYFGRWKDSHDPFFHDCITGPAEEFEAADTPDRDFQSAAEGTPFLRLGVGLLRKDGDGDFRRFHTYPIIDDAGWQTSVSSNQVIFEHVASSPTGLSYQYRKTLSLAKQAPVLSLAHTLVNTGRVPIATRQYNHNFFRIDGLPPGPSLHMTAPIAPSMMNPAPGLLSIDGGRASLLRCLRPGESILAELTQQSAPYDLAIFQEATSAGVRICADRPLTRLLLWVSRSVFCPEPYINIHIQPGESFSWNLSYMFYANQNSPCAI